MSSYEKWSLVAMFAGAIATFLAVAVALFGAKIKRFFEKPELVFSVSDDYSAECYRSSDNGSDSDSFDICGTLTNNEKYCAEHTKVICNGIFIQEANKEKYCPLLKNFRQKQFEWLEVPMEKVFSEINIFHGVEYYVKIAEISQEDKPGENVQSSDDKNAAINKTVIPDQTKTDENEQSHDDKNTAIIKKAIPDSRKLDENEQSPDDKNEAIIKIAIPDPRKSGSGFLSLNKDQKSVLVSIVVLSSSLNPLKQFVKIDWKGDKVKGHINPEYLSVSLLSNAAARKMIKIR